MTCLITVLVILQVVVWAGTPKLGKILLVVELQEVGSFSAEAQKGRRQAARQGHEPSGATETRDRKP